MGRAKRERQFWESGLLNNSSYIQYYDRLTELAISMFDWKNLPEEIDARFLELTLFTDGKILFFRDDDLEQYLVMQVAANGKLDNYRIPTERRAYSITGYTRKLSEDDSVIIYNNMLHKNSRLDVEMFSRRLYNLDRTIDINVNAQKTPVLIKCAEQERLTMVNLYKEYDGNMPVIYGDKQLNDGAFGVLRTDAPYMADKLYQLKTQIWNEALTYLGISNINVQKKERLITDEVTRNQGGTIASRYSRLESRRMAADKINKMFGLNIEVEYREDYHAIDNGLDTENKSESEDESVE